MLSKAKTFKYAQLPKYVVYMGEVEFLHHHHKKVVQNPTIYGTLPDGLYVIRTNKRNQRQTYVKAFGRWFLLHDRLVNRYEHFYILTEFNIFPNLPKKEWDFMAKNRKYLSTRWLNYLLAYEHWLELNNVRRETKLALKVFKK